MATIAEADLLPIPAALLAGEKYESASIYILDEYTRKHRLYRAPGVVVAPADVRRLERRGIRELFLPVAEYAEFQRRLRDTLEAKLRDESCPVTERFQLINETLRSTLEEQFRKGSDESIVQSTKQFSSLTVELLNRNDTLPSACCSLLHHDFYTFTHCTNVSFYAVMLARALGVRSELELREIAEGGLLHDLGKLEISNAILCKPGKLSEAEFAVIKNHPRAGFMRLNRRNDISFGQLMMAYQHHEAADGSGYPVGIGADEIHPWAKICTVIDVYEALTSRRPYRRRLSTSEAFEIMDKTQAKFDAENLKCWKSLMRQR